jgi:amino acid adenylation domain-containing protein
MSHSQESSPRSQMEDLYPLSPMQRGMLFHALYDPGSPVYFEQVSYRIHGHLDLSAFQRAWQRVVDRHPVLRTSFHSDGLDEPLQMVRRQVKLPFLEEDWTAFSPSKQEEQLKAFQTADRERGFKLTQAPLLRLAVFRLARDIHQIVLSFHHLYLDGWSVALVINDVLAHYKQFRQGREWQSERRRPYRDYVAWLGQQDLAGAERFWRTALAGFTSPTPFGVDSPRDPLADRTASYATKQTKLSTSATQALDSLARRHLLTLNTLVQGAWSLLLSRYSGEDDILFGATVSGRPAGLTGVELMVGLFINTLPVRVRVRREQSVLSFLQELQDRQGAAREYEYAPLVKIQSWSEVPAGIALFESLMVFENYPMDQGANGELSDLEIRDTTSFEMTNYPVTVLALPGRQLSLRIDYDRRRFDDETIERMLGHFKRLLEGMVRDPEQRVSELTTLSESEQRQLLVEWNHTRADYPQGECLHQLFELQVERSPDAVALVFEEQALTYRELNARANQLAHHLRAVGVGPEVLVGVCMERSPELLVGLLGVLKAGGAYVPLDPDYPHERLRLIIADAHVGVLLTEDSLSDRFADLRVPVLRIDGEWPAIARQPRAGTPSPVDAQNLAYVMFTSGSTGRPKGVQIPHRAVVNFIETIRQRPGVTPADAFVSVTTISFDISVLELFVPLLTGARLIIAAPDTVRDGPQLARLAERSAATIMQGTPATWRLLLEGGWQGTAGFTILIGGQALSRDLATQLLRGGPQVWNMYGPTETTIWSTTDAVQPAPDTITIGRPIANTQVYVLDGAATPLPVGVPGELYLGGDGLSRGYWDRPELTATAFVPSPFDAGHRLYRTGDRVRYLADGRIEFLGRIDHQVKIRGFRIELGEIETVLTQHPEVREAVVLARQDGADDSSFTRLVAYVVSESQSGPGTSELRRHLKERLPDYMVPAVFIALDSLPLTPNGKLDRKALPAPDQTRPELDDDFVLPRNDGEKILAEIWSQVLHVAHVGIHDNFFELGGDSILSIQIVSKANQAGLNLTPKDIFEHPTVAKLALRTGSSAPSVPQPSAENATPSRFPLAGVDGDTLAHALGNDAHVADVYPLSPIQQGLLFHSLLQRTSKTYFIQLGIVIRGDLRVPAFQRAWQQVVDRHALLRTSFHHQGLPRPLQVVHQQVEIHFDQQDWRELAADTQKAQLHSFLAADREGGFDLSRAPLMRLTLLQVSDDTYEFIWSYHHLLLDGWSLPLVLKDVVACYEAETRGTEPRLEHPRPYRDYIAWLGEQEFSAARTYWQEALRGFTAPTSLGVEDAKKGRTDQAPAYEDRSIKLSRSSTEALRSFGRRNHVTLNTLLQAAWGIQLSRYSGEHDVLFGATLSGRSIPLAGIDSMVGIFINTLPVRVRVSEEQSVLSFLRELQADHLEARRFEYTPLVELQGWSEVPAGVPLFESVMVVENYPVDETLQRQSTSGLDFQAAELEGSELTNYPVTMLAVPGRQMSLRIVCDSRRFDGPTIERMLDHCTQLLEGIVADPERRVSDVPMLSESEKRRLLVEWNATEAVYPRGATIHELFEAQVEQTPDRVALVVGDEQLSYRALNARANQLAHHLRRLGVGPQVLVGVCVERSVEMVVGLLGILKAGGAYVALDPDYPASRLQFMVEDAQAGVLLTQQRLRDRLPEHTAHCICLDTEWESIATTQSTANLRVDVPENTLSHVIYTSGSTGRPKGVAIEHRSVATLVHWSRDHYANEDLAGVLASTSICFDLSVWEFFVPLSWGGTVHVAPNALHLPTLATAHAVTLINTVPSAMTELVRMGGVPASVRRVNLAGEPLHPDLVRKIYALGHIDQVCDLYGPSEDTTYSTFAHRVLDGPATIGRPIANTQAYLLRGDQQPVPLRVSGELHLGGDGLARGYLRRPDLTAEKFIPDAFASRPGARLYRTGDLARYLEDGNLEFQGRRDHQVKVRGFRIELGEIEAALKAHPSVQDAVVLARHDAAADPESARPTDVRLVAYVVHESQPGPETQELRSYLKARIPDYMVPAVFVTLDALPLTPNGKLDRKALPNPDQTRPELEHALVEPRTKTEETVASIWRDLLRVEKIGVHHDFFELGGHSLIATQLTSRVRHAFGIELPLDEVFRASTVAALAERIDNACWALESLQLQTNGVGSDVEEGEI